MSEIMSLPIWLLIGVAALVVLDVVLFLADRYIMSFFVLLGTIFGLHYFFQTAEPILTFVQRIVADYAVYYLIAGVVVATIKWIIHCMKTANIIGELVAKFKRIDNYVPRNELGDNPSQYAMFVDYVETQAHSVYSHGGVNYLLNTDDFSSIDIPKIQTKDQMDKVLTPMARNYKARITFWVLQWPLVVATMFIEDLLIKIGHRVAELLDFALSKVARQFIARATSSIGV